MALSCPALRLVSQAPRMIGMPVVAGIARWKACEAMLVPPGHLRHDPAVRVQAAPADGSIYIASQGVGVRR
jgi:hypothetical protein